MQFEFDPETLIDEVKKRPGLWDHETLEYRSKHYKQDAWEEIVRTLSGSTDISKTEMRELGKRMFSFTTRYCIGR